MFGTAVASSSPAVAARCSFAEAGVGAVSSQNITDPMLGFGGLALMRAGAAAPEAVKILKHANDWMEYRQLLAVDKNGETAIFSGEKTLGVRGEARQKNAACAGNLLADEKVIGAMMDGFTGGGGHFGDRLLAALESALAAGGEAGAIHSAGMKIVRKTAWEYVDLRCDWSDNCPVAALKRAWDVYKPQMDDYIQRALKPASAPAFGAPGEKNNE